MFLLLSPLLIFGHVGATEDSLHIEQGVGECVEAGAEAQLKEYIGQHTEFPVFETESAEEASVIVRDLVAQRYDAVFYLRRRRYAEHGLPPNSSTPKRPSASFLSAAAARFARCRKIPMGAGKKPCSYTKNTRWCCAIRAPLNGKHFVNVAGVGYSAHIAKSFKYLDRGRGLFGYIKGYPQKPGPRRAAILPSRPARRLLARQVVDGGVRQRQPMGLQRIPGRNQPLGRQPHDSRHLQKNQFCGFAVPGLPRTLQPYARQRYVAKLKGPDFEVEYNDILPMHIDGDFSGKSRPRSS